MDPGSIVFSFFVYRLSSNVREDLIIEPPLRASSKAGSNKKALTQRYARICRFGCQPPHPLVESFGCPNYSTPLAVVANLLTLFSLFKDSPFLSPCSVE